MRVALVSAHLSHYRQDVYEALGRSEVNDYSFFGSLRSWQGIKPVDRSRIAKIFHVELVEVGRLRWQRLRSAEFRIRDFDVIVLLGDANIISNWIVSLFARVRGRKVIFWTTGWHKPDKLVKRFLRLIFYSLAHHLVLYSEFGRTLSAKMGYPSEKMTVIYNSVPLGALNQDLVQLPSSYSLLSDGKVNLGAVIRLNPVKRLDYLIKAVARLPNHQEKYRVVFVGAGPDRDHLLSVAAELDVECLIMEPIYDRTALAKVYAHMSLTVVPKVAGLSVIQSMSFGVPVISDDNMEAQAPEVEAIVHGVTGALYQAENIDDLALQIQEVVRSLEDPVRAAAYHSACLDEVRARWTGDSQASKIDAVISSIT